MERNSIENQHNDVSFGGVKLTLILLIYVEVCFKAEDIQYIRRWTKGAVKK